MTVEMKVNDLNLDEIHEPGEKRHGLNYRKGE